MGTEVLSVIMQVAVLVFVVSSMLAMGLGLTLSEIVGPLKKPKLVAAALVANFIAVPLAGWGVSELLSLEEDLALGLVLIAVAAGAPFLPKLASVAKGDVAFSVGLMVLLMVVTVGFLPIALPLLLSGVEVSVWDIASSLIFLMMLPLAVGLLVRARYSRIADGLQGPMTQTSTVAIALVVVAGVIVNFTSIVEMIGTGGFVAIILFLAVAYLAGIAGAGRSRDIRSVLGLGTAQRNISAALVVAGQNFSDRPNTLTFIIVAALVGLILLMPLAGELGKRR